MDNIAYPYGWGNGSSDPASAPPGTPEHYRYWQSRLVIECSRTRRAAFPPNPELRANVSAYWNDLFNEGSNGSSTETT